MSDCDYKIRPDAVGDLLRISLRGHWTKETLARFQSDLAQAKGNMRLRGSSGNCLLIDARDHGVQSQDVITGIRLGMSLEVGERVAILVSSALHKMQLHRTKPEGRVKICQGEAEAMAWLHEA